MEVDASLLPTLTASVAVPSSFAKLFFFLDELIDTVNLVFTRKGLEIISVDSTSSLLAALIDPRCSRRISAS